MEIAFRPVESCESISADWDALYAADPEANYFVSRAFLEPAFRSRPGECHLLVAKERGRLVGLFPLRLKTVWDDALHRFRTDIVMPGSAHWADYTGLLVDPACDERVLDAFAGALSNRFWGRLRFKNLAISSARRDRLLGSFSSDRFSLRFEERRANGGQTNNLISPRLDLPADFDIYLDGLGSSTRQKLRRLLRQLDAGDFSISFGRKPADADTVADLWVQRWQGKKGRKAVNLGKTCRRILLGGIETKSISMPILKQGDRTLGALASFLDPIKRQVLFFVAARDLTISKIPVGFILHADAIRRAILDGYQVYDFLRGDEAYKFQLGAQPRSISYPVLRRRSSEPPDSLLDRASLSSVLWEIPRLLDADRHRDARTAAEQAHKLSV